MKIQELHDYPPYSYLEFILLHCPHAAWTYMKLWGKRDKNNTVTLDKNTIRYEFLKSATKFKNELLYLAKEALINIQESETQIIIELVGWDEEEHLNVC